MNDKSQELFRFVTTRRVERFRSHLVEGRLIRDPRENDVNSILDQLFGSDSYETKLAAANAGALSARFVLPNDGKILLLDASAAYFRDALISGKPLTEIANEIQETYPNAKGLLNTKAPSKQLNATIEFIGMLWDSLYTQTIIGFDRFVSTNYLVDALRVYHILRLLWLHLKDGRKKWDGGTFDDYDIIISLPQLSNMEPSIHKPNFNFDEQIGMHSDDIVELDFLENKLDLMFESGDFKETNKGKEGKVVFDDSAIAELSKYNVFDNIEISNKTVDELSNTVANEKRRITSELSQLQARKNLPALKKTRRDIEINKLNVRSSKSSTTLRSGFDEGVFRTKINVGLIRPPVVGDLILVEQELRRYELGELAEIENVMRGEKREYSTRNLSRTNETSSFSNESETSETESLKTDERFQLSNQATKAANNSFSADVGVSVSAKYGPVQTGVTANASYSQSKSSSESQSQDFSRQITEEATKNVRNLIKESSTTAILTEVERNTLHGFNNVDGASHSVGLYRWVDKIYAARTVNYGRRLMLTFDVPEPAAFFRGGLAQNEMNIMAGLEEPKPPGMYHWDALESTVSTKGGTTPRDRFDNHKRITEESYASLAALYDVKDIAPPPANKITGTKAISYPSTNQAGEVVDHQKDGNELSYVAADNSLRVDPNYKVKTVGIWGTKGENHKFGWYADILKMGIKNKDTNSILVLIGDKSFYFVAENTGGDKRDISTNFNKSVDISDSAILSGVLEPSLPISIQADFEGILSFTVIYTAYLRDEAFEAWQIDTWAAILKGYERKKQDYEQNRQLAEQKINENNEAVTYQLRDTQYREIEQTELKRGCIDLLTEGTATGYSPINIDSEANVTINYDNSSLSDWRSPIANGVAAEFFEEGFEWDQMTYQFFPYYWTSESRWRDLMEQNGSDPTFEKFLKSGQAKVTVAVKPGNERAVMLFLKTGLIWSGGYLPLYDSQDVLEVYSDVEMVFNSNQQNRLVRVGISGFLLA